MADPHNILGFEAALNRAALEFKKISRSKSIKLVSNLDADGIAAASIMKKAMDRLNMTYSLTILHQLTEEVSRALSDEDFDYILFCDLGSGQLSSLNTHYHGRTVFILDHHEIQGKPGPNIVHINPHDHGIDGSQEISAAGVCFLFAAAMDKKNEDLAHLAVIGAIGDAQEKNGFCGLNKKILEIAVRKKKIRVERGLRLFGLESRPLNKLLVHSTDLEIPGISHDEQGTARFLKKSGIRLFDSKKRARTYYSLKDAEKKKLADGIIAIRRKAGLRNDQDVYANIYILEGEGHGPFRDAREFSTLLNSCGRMDNPVIGIGACLGDERQRMNAMGSLMDYRRELISCMNWYKGHSRGMGSDGIIKGENYIIINAGNKVLSTIIGTLASMISKGNEIDKGIFVMSMAHNDDETTKVSLRIAGNPEHVDLKRIISEITNKTGGESGGHKTAAGAVIPKKKEGYFIDAAIEAFNRMAHNHKT